MKLINKGFLKKYFKLGWPIILSQLIVLGVTNMNVAIMGTLSDKAISGYTIANESYSIFSMVALGLTGGFHVFISQFYGDNNKTKYNQVLRFGMQLSLIVGLIFAAGFCFFAEPFVSIFIKNDAEIAGYASNYLRLFAWAFPLYILNLLWSESYSFTGRARITMVSGTIDCAVNLLCCYLFISGGMGCPKMGIEGAALALLLGRLSESVYLLVTMNLPESEFKFSVRYPRLDTTEKLNVLKTSMPLILNESLFSIAYLFIMKNYSYVSETNIACLTVVNNMSQLFFVLSKGAGPTIGVMVGGELGKGNFKAAKENAASTLATNFMMYIIGAAALGLATPFIPGMFSLGGQLKDLCMAMLIAKCLIGPLGGFTMCFYNILRIGGDTVAVFCNDGLFSCIFPLGISYLCSHIIPVSFFWLFVLTESMQILKAILGYMFYRRGKWITKLS